MKKFMIFLVSLVPIMLILVVQLTSTYIEKTKYVSVENIKISETPSEIYKYTSENVTYELDINVYPVSATNKNLVYESSNENIAVVDENGKITFKDFGEVTITVKSAASERISASSKFFVTDTKPHRIELIEYPETLLVGETFFVKSEVIPDGAENKTITYFSSDTTVATVYPDGKISAVNPGTATITLTTVNGVTERFDLEIIMPVSGIYIPAEQKYRIIGSNTVGVPDAVISPDVATNKNVVYSSDNPELAYIKNNSEIVFNKRGTATFKATTEDGGFNETFSVYYTGGFVVSAEISSISKNVEKDYNRNERFTLDYTVYPLDADLSNVRFESSNENVIAVDGKEFIVKGGGKAVITMFADTGDGEITSVANVYIKRSATAIECEDIEVNSPVFTLNYKILPADSTDSVTFAVNSNVATVTDSGMVTFKDYGEVKITITASSGVKKEITARYTKAGSTIKTIEHDNQELNVNYGDVFTLLFNAELGFGAHTYSIDNSTVLSFDDETKEFTAIAGGTANITATDGTSTYTIIVSVIRYAESLNVSCSDVDFISGKDVVTAKKQITIAASVFPEDTTNKTPKYFVDNSDIAEISSTGVLTFKRAGTITVTVSADSVSFSKTIRSSFGMPDNFELNVSEYTFEDAVGEFNVDITSVSPADCDLTALQINYSSTNTASVTVNGQGVVTAVGKGSAYVTVQIGSVKKSVNVEVKLKTKEISILYNNGKIDGGSVLGESVQLAVSLLPIDADNKNVVWSIEAGEDKASITDNGLLTFNGDYYGTIKVKVCAVDSGISAFADITRLIKPNGINIDIYVNDSSVSDTTLEVAATDNADINVEIRYSYSSGNLLDAENALKYILDNIGYKSVCDDGLTVDISPLENGYYGISKSVSVNKKLSATITFYIDDVSTNLTIEYLNLQNLELELKNEDDVGFGLEQKRVFGTQNFVSDSVSDYTVTNKFVIEYTRKPLDNQDVLYWFTSNDNVAYVDDEGYLVVLYENVKSMGEIQVTITVGNAPVLEDCTIKASYVYTFVPAYNVYDNNDYVRILKNNYSAVLHTDNLKPENADEHEYTGNLYGNGNILNFANYSCKKITFYGNVRNVCIERTTFDKEKTSYKDKVIVLCGKSVEYCILRNTQKVWSAVSSEILIKNCIIERCSQAGLQIGEENVGNIYLENTIFSDVAQAAVDFQAGNLYIKGFFDVYNFKAANEFDFGYKQAIEKAFEDEAFQKFIYTKDDGTKYANISIFVTPDKEPNVYFWNSNINEYVLEEDSAEHGTGLRYEKVEASVSIFFYKIKYYLFCPVIEGNDKNYINSLDVILTPREREKVYRLYSAE